MLVPNRHSSDPSRDYRYGFQGQEMDNELKGRGNSLNYTFRMHDPRVGRFFAVDPLFRQYAYNSPYAFSENRVIQFNELEGRELDQLRIYAKNGVFGKTVQNIVVTTEDITEEVVRSTASAGLIVGSAIFVPIVNQANIVRTEGVHAGGALKKSNYVFEPGVYKLDSNWNIVNMGINNEANIEVAKATVETLATIIPVERLAAPIISRLASKIPAREAIAKLWKLDMDYVNFNKEVYTEILKEGTELVQYRLKAGTKGNYYAYPGTTPEQIGLRAEDVVETYKVIVKQETKVIKSTHIEKKAPYYDKAGKPLDGGGMQIKSENLKLESNSTFEKIDNP